MAAHYRTADYWTQKAHSESFPARSVYKLKEIDEKFRILHPQSTVLDLGAAPGSWSLYVLRRFKPPLELSAVDILPLSRQYDKGLFNAIHSICGDLKAEETKKLVQVHSPFNVILSDAAPATTGSATVDSYRCADLAECALNYVQLMLAAGGSLVVKIFQNGESAQLLNTIRTLFTKGISFKPQACRNESVELYYIGLGFHGNART
ncbi:MAG: RlmE family RNA methyltransferase [Treponema sp.]|jgi:23S rRNA (uridine2552-2'-O)-methyltransferase|nr:RlmE family RNA methyltransferase [Treponema sp.]